MVFGHGMLLYISLSIIKKKSHKIQWYELWIFGISSLE